MARKRNIHESPDPKQPGGPAASAKKQKNTVAAEQQQQQSIFEKRAWSTWLPHSLNRDAMSSVDKDEWKCCFRALLAVVTIKLRVVDDVASIVSAVLPSALASCADELRAWADGIAKELVESITSGHMKYAESLVESLGENAEKIRENVEKRRLSKLKIIRPFPDIDSVQKHIQFAPKDIIELWAPCVAFLDKRYIDNPSGADKLWLEELELSSYKIVGMFAGGMLSAPLSRPGYSKKAQLKDLASTAREMDGWPLFRDFLAWPEVGDRWLSLSDIWPHASNESPAGVDDPPAPVSSGNGGSQAPVMPAEVEANLPEEEMVAAEIAAQNDVEEVQNALEGLIDTPGATVSLQFDRVYVTEEASRIAQLNTAGLLAYTIARLNRREQFYKSQIVWAHDQMEEARLAKEVLLQKQEEARQQEERYLAIMEEGQKLKSEIRQHEETLKRGAGARHSGAGTRRRGLLGVLEAGDLTDTFQSPPETASPSAGCDCDYGRVKTPLKRVPVLAAHGMAAGSSHQTTPSVRRGNVPREQGTPTRSAAQSNDRISPGRPIACDCRKADCAYCLPGGTHPTQPDYLPSGHQKPLRRGDRMGLETETAHMEDE